jgi:hypothetical protein
MSTEFEIAALMKRLEALEADRVEGGRHRGALSTPPGPFVEHRKPGVRIVMREGAERQDKAAEECRAYAAEVARHDEEHRERMRPKAEKLERKIEDAAERERVARQRYEEVSTRR